MQKKHWSRDAIFYHIYPLGLLEAPQRNNFSKEPKLRLEELHPWIDHMTTLGCNALYLGPLFESGTHGYDTQDYFKVDRRLVNIESLQRLIKKCHQSHVHVILDSVFHHVGRDFWAFQDLLIH